MSFLNISFVDLLTFVVLLSFSTWSLWKLYQDVETENTRLIARNAVLSEWLQMAELHTGIPYYSSVAVGAVPHELSGAFAQVVQRRVKALPYSPEFFGLLNTHTPT